jgi:hypothetical protein
VRDIFAPNVTFSRPADCAVIAESVPRCLNDPCRHPGHRSLLAEVQTLRKYTKQYEVPNVHPTSSKEDIARAVTEHWNSVVSALQHHTVHRLDRDAHTIIRCAPCLHYHAVRDANRCRVGQML